MFQPGHRKYFSACTHEKAIERSAQERRKRRGVQGSTKVLQELIIKGGEMSGGMKGKRREEEKIRVKDREK